MQVKDHLVSGEQFTLKKQDRYEILKTVPLPEKLEGYYRSEEYISHTDRRKTALEKIYFRAKQWNLRKKTKLLQRLMPTPGSLLDIGAGTGDFVLASEAKGWNSFGVEPNPQARSLAEQKGARIHKELTGLSLPPLDIITLWHVLEHIPDLDRQTEQIYNALENSGYLILALPNHNSYDAKHYRAFWAGYDVPRHVWHFTQTGVAEYFRDKGFILRNTLPMWLDAFYVSWLSEKYKGNRLAPITAFFVGLWSNVKALGSGEYSSIIYILQKTDPEAGQSRNKTA